MPSESKIQSSALQLQWMLLKLIYECGRGEGISFAELQSRYEDLAGVAVTKRTIERTVAALEDDWNLDIDRSARPFLIRKGKNAKPLSIAGLTRGEASAFMLLNRYLKDGLPPSLLRELAPFFLMAENRLAGDKQTLAWLDNTRFLQRRQPIPAPITDPTVLACVQEAIQLNEILSFTYLHLRENTREQYRVIPLGLILREQVIFLAAEILPLNGNQKKARRTFKLHRVSDATRSYEPAPHTEPFDLDTFMQAQGLEDIDPPVINLEVIFYEHEGDFLLERPVPDGWSYKSLGNGAVQWKARLAETRQLRMWLQHFGAAVEIKKPESLRKKMQSQIRVMSKIYGVN